MKSNENKKSLQPKLRFPEFRFDVEWEIKPLGEIGEIYQPQTISQTDLTSKGFDVYGANGIIGKYHSFNHEFEQIAITCRGSTCGTVNLTNPKSWITGNAMVANVDNNKSVSKKFIFYQLSGANLKYLISGSGQPQITGNIKKHTLSIPPLKEEQQKIADCLSSLDELIEAEDQKLEALQRHKKGLMQELFPAEGQTLPKRRFPEFQSAPEWKTESLGEVAIFINDRISSEELSKDNYISTENILPNFSGVKISSKLPSACSATKYKNNDILVSNIRPYLKKVWIADKNGGASNDVIVIRNKDRVIEAFLAFAIQNDAFIDYVMKGVKGVKMPRGDISSIKDYSIKYPSDKIEQKKIVCALSSISQLITTQTKKLESLRLHKKGLMQQLFPNAGEEEKFNINTNNQNQ
jgi:type I restriction enzyme, S subunit